MSQIFGIGGVHDVEELRRILDRMAAVMRRPGQPNAVIWMDAAAAVGIGCIPETAAVQSSVHDAVGGWSVPCVIDGIFYRGPLSGFPQPEATLVARYADDEASLLRELDGTFSFALYQREQRRLVVVNDRFSTRTVYWAQRAGRFLFASELKALLVVPGAPVQLDHLALAQCAGFNRILGQRTLVRGISRLPGAAILEWNEAAGANLRRYWRLDDVIAERTPLTPRKSDEIVETFRDAVKIRASGAPPLGISLSGGVDSRAIAAVLAAENIHALSCTTGFRGSADQRLAAQVSQVARSAHHFVELRKEAITDFQQALRSTTLVRSEMLLFAGFPSRLDVEFCEAFQIKTLLRGHGGENMKLAEAWPFQVTPTVLGMQKLTQLRGHLRRVLSSCPADVDLDRLMPDITSAAVPELLDAAIDEAVTEHSGLTAPEVVSALYLIQNDGMEVPLTRNRFRGQTEMALPFVDYRLLDLVLSTRVQDRCDIGLHIAIMRRLAPQLLRIGNSNTGAPMDASRLRVYITDKANTLLKRLKVPGFRHYHYLAYWLQGFLAAQVRAVVLDERTLGRGVFARDYLMKVMDRAQGDRRMSQLVNFVMNVEIWCRLFIDGEGLQRTPPAS